MTQIAITRAGYYHVEVAGLGSIKENTGQLHITVNGRVHEPSRVIAGVLDLTNMNLVLQLEEGDEVGVPLGSKYRVVRV